MSSGDGSRRSSLRPDNIRCHARGATSWVPVLALVFVILCRPFLPTLPLSTLAFPACGGGKGRRRVGRRAPAGGPRLYVAASSRLPGRTSEHLCHLVLKTLRRWLGLCLCGQDFEIRRRRRQRLGQS